MIKVKRCRWGTEMLEASVGECGNKGGRGGFLEQEEDSFLRGWLSMSPVKEF